MARRWFKFGSEKMGFGSNLDQKILVHGSFGPLLVHFYNAPTYTGLLGWLVVGFRFIWYARELGAGLSMGNYVLMLLDECEIVLVCGQ